jgi:hypothetical protein
MLQQVEIGLVDLLGNKILFDPAIEGNRTKERLFLLSKDAQLVSEEVRMHASE